MSLEEKYNTKSPAVKRLMREAQELYEATEEYHASPLDDNLFEWHFTVKGPSATEFEGGIYHGRIILPPEYPMKPPNIIMLTPNGRFEIHKKICLSISGHHPESWQPSWSIRTALLALIAFMPTPGNETIGSLDYSPEERQKLAKKSQHWECETCGKIIDLLVKTEGTKTIKKNSFNHINLAGGKTIGLNFNIPPSQSPQNTTTTTTVNNITESLRQRLVDRQRLETLMQRSSSVNQINMPSFNDFLWSIIIIILLLGIILLSIRRVFFI